MAEQQGASFNPDEFGKGGTIPDGRYTITKAQTQEFDYGGNAAAVPAACFVFKSQDGHEYEQNYSAGKLENLVPNQDGTMFVHPRGEKAIVNDGSNFALFLKAMKGAGFPWGEVTNKITCFLNADVEIVNQAQPKRNLEGSKDKTIPLPTKYYGKAGKAAARPTTTAAKPVAAPKAATATSSVTPASAPNGDLDADAIIAVQEVLAIADGNKTTITRLGTAVMLTLAKAKNPNAQAIRKLLTADWLTANMEVGSWVVDGQDIALVS